ncbi:MAG: hypothetical protein OXC96_01300 [Cyanobacteria bacterium MAG CAR1_bin_15]|nr:hypothetical protein [Cyanobacteria bacterium MAG CAR1_bin_15]
MLPEVAGWAGSTAAGGEHQRRQWGDGGGSASFTLSASPVPSASLAVSVIVAQSGKYGVSTGQRTVTVSTGGSVVFTVGTTDDSTDEADGSVTATVDGGSGYRRVSTSQGAATVSVAEMMLRPPRR